MTATCAPLYSTPGTASRKNLVQQAIGFARVLGIDLMPWQIEAVALFTELDPTGHFAYRSLDLLVGRQNGKSTLALLLLLLRCYSAADTRCVYGAQTLKDSRAMLLETWWPLISDSPLASTATLRSANGSERILFHTNNSSIQLLTTTSASAGHGQVVDFGILDEAFSQMDPHVEAALVPAMATRADHGGFGPQFLVMSNAGTLDGKSPYLWDRVQRGRALAQAGTTSTSAYLEYGAPEDADPSLESTWLAANPAAELTIDLSSIQAEYESMSTSEFRRARLCQWTVQANEPVVDLQKWLALEDQTSDIVGPLIFATDVAPGREHASISVGGKRADGKFHVEVIDSRPGTGWLPRSLQKLVKRHDPIGIYIDAQTNSLVPEIEESGVFVTKLEASDAASSFAFFLESVSDGSLRWRSDVDGGDLQDALVAATTRPLGDGGAAWNRSGTEGYIDNLVSITLALWAARSRLSGGVTIFGASEYTKAEYRLDQEAAARQEVIYFTGQPEDDYVRLLRGRTYDRGVRMLIARGFSSEEATQIVETRRDVLAS